MISHACFEATERLDVYLADPDWRSSYDARTLARADVLRAGLEALRLLLDTTPEAGTAIEAAIAGDDQALDAQIAVFAQEWHQQEKPNLNFSPHELGEKARAAVVILRAIDEHLVPLLPQVQPLMPEPPET